MTAAEDRARELAAERVPPLMHNIFSGSIDLNEPLRNAFTEGYLAGYRERDAEVEKEWEDHHGDTGA